MDRTLARKERMEAAAASIAAALRSDPEMHQEHAALNAGVPRRTYYEWLNGDDELCVAFQRVVLAAVHEQAQRNLEHEDREVRVSEGKLTNWAKWRLEKRYRLIFGDLATVTRHEVTGRDGGPIETHSLSDAEIAAKLAALAGKEESGDGG